VNAAGQTALHMASLGSSMEIVSLLLEKGCKWWKRPKVFN
jgi:ankyrin repeat protein